MVCCCICNIFCAAKGLTMAEIVLILFGVILGFFTGSIGYDIFWILLQLAYLAVEYYGIHKADKFLILFGCIIRVLQTIIIAILIIAFFAIPICPDMLGTQNCDELRSQVEQENNAHETNFTDDQLFEFSISAFRYVLITSTNILFIYFYRRIFNRSMRYTIFVLGNKIPHQFINNSCTYSTLLFFTFSIIFIVVGFITLVWTIFRTYVQFKAYSIVKQSLMPRFILTGGRRTEEAEESIDSQNF